MPSTMPSLAASYHLPCTSSCPNCSLVLEFIRAQFYASLLPYWHSMMPIFMQSPSLAILATIPGDPLQTGQHLSTNEINDKVDDENHNI
eukprot:1198288-Ditylum_brightwellii.AAC.1